jgi:hypothetical protein
MRPIPQWYPNPHYEECDCLVDGEVVNGEVKNGPGIIATVEDFGYACYPTAYNPRNKEWERHGPTQDRVEARLWCERIAGLHPLKEGDESTPFYYESRCRKKQASEDGLMFTCDCTVTTFPFNRRPKPCANNRPADPG